MTAPGKQWATRELLVEEVRQHRQFQLRADGLKRPHVTRLLRELKAGKDLPPIRVAAIGRALYLVDGFHRLEAYRLSGSLTVPAEVARMGLQEAREEAELANTRHGLSLSRADKAAVWQAYVTRGGHLDDDGVPKSSRAIGAELNQLYSHETIRRRLKALGLELNEGDTFKPWRPYEPTEEELEEEMIDEAEVCLTRLGVILPTLAPLERQRLLRATRDLLDAVESGETGRAELETIRNPLDI